MTVKLLVSSDDLMGLRICSHMGTITIYQIWAVPPQGSPIMEPTLRCAGH